MAEKRHTSMRVDAAALDQLQEDIDRRDIDSFSGFMDMLIKSYLVSSHGSDFEYEVSPERFDAVRESIEALESDLDRLEREIRQVEFLEDNDISVSNTRVSIEDGDDEDEERPNYSDLATVVDR